MKEKLLRFAEQAVGFFRRYRAARIAGCVLLALILLTVVLHPRGTKTFLILGMDNYGSLSETGRSDVMMLVQIDFTRSDVSTVTFARDMFIPDPNGRQQKINAIVRNQDEEALVQSIENAFGLEIDGWFRVNFTTVIELVDAIGGAHIELTEKEVNYLNRTAGYYPDYPLAEGMSHLNGGQALQYARCRALDNDIGRGQRQSKLMAAMVAQTRHLTVARIVNVFNSLKHAWTSSLSGMEQVKLLSSALWLRGAKVSSVGVPFEGYWHYGNVRGNNGVVADMEDNVRLLREALGLPALAAPNP
ncbi:MAG: LCP family protein [Clostridia bacterium]|nr:LCP family protein [Clostridia bacterium]